MLTFGVTNILLPKLCTWPICGPYDPFMTYSLTYWLQKHFFMNDWPHVSICLQYAYFCSYQHIVPYMGIWPICDPFNPFETYGLTYWLQNHFFLNDLPHLFLTHLWVVKWLFSELLVYWLLYWLYWLLYWLCNIDHREVKWLINFWMIVRFITLIPITSIITKQTAFNKKGNELHPFVPTTCLCFLHVLFFNYFWLIIRYN
jgi:hypothetical protein